MQMHYEFEYFYEPQDPDLRIRKLFIEVELLIEQEDLSESTNNRGIADVRHSVTVDSLTIRDAFGRDITHLFSFLRPRIVEEFQDLHRDRAIAQLEFEGGI